MEGNTVLLPYNFTPQDQKALKFVVRYLVPEKDSCVTLYHGYTPVPKVASDGHSVMGRLKENLSYLNQKITELEAALMQIKIDLVKNGLGENQVKIVFKPRKKEISAEILELVQREHYTMIVLNRKPGKVSRFFTGSVFHRVVSAARNTTVCVVS